jgi:hypothetical protein
VVVEEAGKNLTGAIAQILSTPELCEKMAGLFAPEATPERVKALAERGLSTHGDAMQIALKFVTNGFEWDSGRGSGTALFETGSLFAHSCRPSCAFSTSTEEENI